MARAPGWIRLAGIGLELTALAYIGYVVMDREGKRPRLGHPQPVPGEVEAIPADDTDAPADDAGARESGMEPMEFLKESADEDARFYRALDETGEVLAGFYADGRVRLADTRHRLAGMLQSGCADMLEIDNNQWSQLFVRTTPTGRMQLEIRGGPYDARVLTCETLK